MTKIVEHLSAALDERETVLRGWEARYRGETPFVLLTASQREQLAHRLSSLSINFGALAVDLLNERLRLTGFAIDGKPDLDLWGRWLAQGMDDGAGQVQRDALALGVGYCSVWADEQGEPTVVPEAASQAIVRKDPVTRRAVVGFKRWRADGRAHGILYEPDRLVVLTSASHVPDEVGVIPPNGWVTVRTLPNPLGVVPLVDVTNLGSITDVYGVSELAATADLVDALQKVMLDSLVSSHETGTPRRWATGTEIEEDDEGNAVDPWSGGTTTVQSENEGARFGQFSASDLRGFEALAGLLTRQIGALSGLSPQALGLHADTAMSADAIRASEASLVARAEARARTFGRSWANVAALMVAVRDNRNPRSIKATALWADPATRSEAHAADAAAKLNGAGVLSREGTLERLGFGPDEIERENSRLMADAARAVMITGVTP